MQKSLHQKQVEEFMIRAGQSVPAAPTEPDGKTRMLRAKLILEEAIETCRALGVVPYTEACGVNATLDEDTLHFDLCGDFDMVDVIDGCCDLAVVATGTLSACGVPDRPFQHEVNRNNLDKLGPSSEVREDGKIMKPTDHQPPDIAGILSDIQKGR